MKKTILSLLICAATIGYAEVGSVISFFRAGTSSMYKGFFGMARDTNFVYFVHYDVMYNDDYIKVCSPEGGRVRNVRINIGASPWSADSAHLGEGYLALFGPSGIMVVDKTTGSTVTSFTAYGKRGCLWDGVYYYTADRQGGTFHLYTSHGSSAGSWRPKGWPAALTDVGGCGFSRYACKAEGRYLIASPSRNDQPYCIADIDTGSLIATWNMYRSSLGGVCGLAYPRSYGDSYWLMLYVGANTYWVYQVDIDGRHVGVVPASVGKIKALHR
ncbi:MAG: hypothetical protein GTN49_07590 [candidate division Zixibacteria bacterium]|nr:hypothetical protein [candidate division Zixibacteria bacterium]